MHGHLNFKFVPDSVQIVLREMVADRSAGASNRGPVHSQNDLQLVIIMPTPLPINWPNIRI